MSLIIAAGGFSIETKRAKKHGQLFGADRVECVLRITGEKSLNVRRRYAKLNC